MSYRPHIIRPPSAGFAYLMTCKKESASGLVNWLNEKRISASLTGAETTEHMETDGREEEYIVSEIGIDPPISYEKLKAVVDSWLESSP